MFCSPTPHPPYSYMTNRCKGKLRQVHIACRSRLLCCPPPHPLYRKHFIPNLHRIIQLLRDWILYIGLLLRLHTYRKYTETNFEHIWYLLLRWLSIPNIIRIIRQKLLIAQTYRFVQDMTSSTILWTRSVASFVLYGGGGARPPKCADRKKDSRTCNLYARASASDIMYVYNL